MRKLLASVNPVPVIGLALLTTGVAHTFSWPWALIVAGSVMLASTWREGA